MTYSKVKSNGSATNWAEFSNGGSITFDVNTSSTLRIGFYNPGSLAATSVTYNGTVLTTTDTVSAEGAVVTYVIPGAGNVVVSFTNSGYLGMIQVDTSISETTGLAFYGSTITGVTNVVKWADNKVVGTQDRFTIAGTNYGNANYLEFKKDDTITFEVSLKAGEAAKIIVSSYNDKQVGIKLGDTDLALTKDESSSGNNQIYSAFATSSGTITISATNDQNYLNYIVVEIVTAA
jgi:hypothetical protein